MKTTTLAVLFSATLASIVEAAVPANFPQLMLTAVNAERAKANLSPFCTNSKLQKSAQLHSDDQAANNFMSHTGSTGSTMSTRITAQKFKWNSIAENVAAGQADVAAVMVSWMNSPGHRANILGKYKFFGTGYAFNAKASFKHYWTQDFATGSSESCDEAPRDADSANTSTPTVTTAVPTPAPTTVNPTPAPTNLRPTPAPTTVAPPTPAPTMVTPPTPAPTPTSTTVAPTPAPTTNAPTPASTPPMPTPAPTTAAPTMTPTSTPTPTPVPTAERAADATLQQRMLTAVNAERAKAGKGPFCTNNKLQKAAQLHSEDQAANNFMSHTGSNKSTMQSRIEAQKFNWNSLGENVAAGQADVAAVMVSWMNSPGHRANILGDFKFFGMGYALNAKASFKHYWTQDFAKGSSEACDV